MAYTQMVKIKKQHTSFHLDKARVFTNLFLCNSLPTTTMAMKTFYNEIKGLKVRELYSYLKPKFTPAKIKEFVSNGMENYRMKYIETSSPDPIFHLCYGGMIFSYLVALPEERRHLAHAQHAKEHGGH